MPQHRADLRAPAAPRPAPQRFTAHSIQVDLPVIRSGVTADGQMQLPRTNREVAWYEFGSRPGAPRGTTVLAAHVDTWTEGLGPFSRLKELDHGAGVEVTDARGRTHSYSVTSIDDVKKSDVLPDELFRQDGPPELKILTCGGPYSRHSGYRDNIVVTARPH